MHGEALAVITTSTATILVTDLVGSTALRTSIGEEAADTIRRDHDARLAEAVTDANGWVVKGTGDGILARFESATDALTAAVEVQRSAAELGWDHARDLRLRVGLAAGDVSFEDDDCFGTPVIEAARLCDSADGGQILCTTLVTLLARGRGNHIISDLGDLALKGLDDPVGVHEVGWEPKARGGPLVTPFVGRGREGRVLADHLAALRSGVGGTVLITGEPGIGKTRLLDEFLAGIDAPVLRGTCREGGAVPYEPFAEAVVAWARSVDDPGEQLGELAPVLTRLAPTLTTEIGQVDPPPVVATEAEALRSHDTFLRFVERVGDGYPVVLVADDLHWADHGSVELLRALGRAARSRPLLVLGAYRETDLDRTRPLGEALAELHREAEPSRVALDGLATEDVERFVSSLARQDVPAALVDALVRETAGNPFFLREVLLHLVEEGQLRREDDRWVGGDASRLDLPEGVRQVVGRRLSRLGADVNTLLAVGSLFDDAFPLRVAADVAGLDEATALDAVDAALAAQVIEPGPEIDGYVFTHALFRHALEDELSPSRAVRLHRAIAEVLADEDQSESAAAAAIARHFLASAVLPGAERGAPYAVRAAQTAAEAGAHGDAAAAFGAATELLPDGPDDVDLLESRLREQILAQADRLEILAGVDHLRELLAAKDPDHGSARLARLAGVAEAVDMAAAWDIGDRAWTLHDPEQHDQTWAQLRSYALARAEHDDPENPGIPLDSPERRELNDIVRRQGLVPRGLWSAQPQNAAEARRWADDERAAPLDRALGYVFASGDLADGEACAQRARTEAHASGDIGTELFAVAVLIRLASMRGERATVDELFAEGAALADRVPPLSNPAMQFAGATTLARPDYIRPGDLPDNLVGADVADQSWAGASVTAGLAVLAAQHGDVATARAAVDALVPAITRAIIGAANYPIIIGFVCSAEFLVGDDRHVHVLRDNLERKVLEPGFRYLEATTESAMACLAFLSGDMTAARRWWQASVDRLESIGMRGGLTMTLESVAIAEFRVGNEAAFVEAARRYGELSDVPSLTLEREIAEARSAASP